MTNWPSAGTVQDVPSERNLRILRKRGGELERELGELKKEGLPPSGKAGGVLKGSYPNPEFAKEPAYKAELENETTARKEVDGILKGEVETEEAAREAADKAEKEAREAADTLEKSKREEADNERVKGPASATESDIAIYNGATGKVIKDSGKTITSVLEEAKSTAEALASAAAAGLSIKNPVAYATTAALTVSKATEKTLEGTAPLTIDGNSAWLEGTRVLLKNQALPAQNGIFEVTTDEAFAGVGKFGGAGKFAEGSKWILTRTKDADETSEVKQGMYVAVQKGTTNAGSSWTLATPDPITIGTTAQEFSPFTAVPGGTAGGDLKGTYPNPMIKDESIVNLDVSNTAAIEYKKLSLAGKILGSDIAEKTVEDSDLASPNNSVYKTLLFAASPFGAGTTQSTFLLGDSSGGQIAGGNVTKALPVRYLDPTDYAVTEKTTKYRVRAQVFTNATAPTSTFTVGLYPVSTVAGAAGGLTYNLGAVVSGSTVAFAAPGASSRNQNNSGDFTPPAANYFVLAVVISVANVAANSWVNVMAQLETRNT